MDDYTSRRFPVLAIRTLLSLSVCCLGLLAAWLAHSAFDLLQDSHRRRLNPDPIFLDAPAGTVASQAPMEPMWPRYPTVSTRNPIGGVLNGVRVVTEEWEGRGSSDAILDFYRGQMLSRGWEDETEKSLGLGPDLLASTTDPRLLQDPGFLSQYENVVGRTMVLGRGDFSMIVQIESVPGRPEMNRVRITGAATPDVVRFAIVSFVHSGGPSKPQSPVPALRFEGRIGSERHRATFSVSAEPPPRAFRKMVDALQRDQWRTLSQTELSAGPEHRTWLVRGKQHALLSASPDRSGRGTALAFTELGPE